MINNNDLEKQNYHTEWIKAQRLSDILCFQSHQFSKYGHNNVIDIEIEEPQLSNHTTDFPFVPEQ